MRLPLGKRGLIGLAVANLPLARLSFSHIFLTTRRYRGDSLNISSSTRVKLHEAALMTRDSFLQRLYTFSRINFDASQSEDAYVQLKELLAHRIRQVSPKVLHEHIHLAFVAKFPDLVVDIFYRSLLEGVEQQFMLSDYVVDSAFQLENPEDLLKMATYCSASCIPGATESKRREILAEFLLCRCFWRLACLFVSSSKQKAIGQAVKFSPSVYETTAQKVFALMLQSLPKESTTSSLVFANFFRLVQRLSMYDTSGDMGEMSFYRECVTRNILVSPAAVKVGPGGLASAKPVPMLSTEISELELFYAILIISCTAGRHVSVAVAYFDNIRNLVKNDVDSDATGGTQRISYHIAEFVVYRFLAVLQSSKENAAITQLARSLISEAVPISISVWSIILISAGEMRAADVALYAYKSAQRQMEETTGGVAERRGVQYLLQTALNALSKCQVPSFENRYLQAARDAGLNCTDEFFFSCLLQDAHNSMNPLERSREVRNRMDRLGVPLTAQLISRLLKIYLRAEDKEYLLLYRLAAEKLNIFRRPWLDGLLLWADRRRYSLSPEDRGYILREIQNRLGLAAKEHLGGLRTQFSLLEYDFRIQPCAFFLKKSQPPDTEPSVQDPRLHFLTRRPSNTWRGVLCKENCGDERLSARLHRGSQNTLARRAFLAAQPVICVEDEGDVESFRIVLAEVLSSLQTSNNVVG